MKRREFITFLASHYRDDPTLIEQILLDAV
jgi:hypothetical protein